MLRLRVVFWVVVVDVAMGGLAEVGVGGSRGCGCVMVWSLY